MAKIITLGSAVKKLTDRSDDYLKRLADELMLDELLCGECDPVEFLKRSMTAAYLDQSGENKKKLAEKMINDAKEIRG